MGPRSEERGNAVAVVISGLTINKLQWGRVPKNAEMITLRRLRYSLSCASMGPRS